MFSASGCDNFSKENIFLEEDYYSFMTQEEMRQRRFVKKLDEYDSERSVCFLDESGFKHLYIFAMPIRYLDLSNLQTITIDDRITNNMGEDGETYPYKTAQSDMPAKFPKKLSAETGILIENNERSIEFCPLEKDKRVTGKYKERENLIDSKKNMIVYEYGEFDFFSYPTLTGTENEVVFGGEPEKYSYEFMLKTDKLKPVMTKSGYILLMDENSKNTPDNENISGIIQIPVLRDSNKEDPKVSMNNVLRLKKAESGQYIVTVGLDRDFLKNADLQYPVRFNLPVEFKRGNQPDTQVYSYWPDKNMYLTNCYSLGYDTTLGIGKTYIRFDIGDGLYINPRNIESVKYITYSLNRADADIKLNEVLEWWCSVRTTWKTKVETGDTVSSVKAGGAGKKAFDITEIAADWYEDETYELESYGLMIFSDSQTGSILMLSNDNALYNVRTEIIFR